MSNATYCTEEKQKKCEHWDAEIGDCEHMRKDKSCFIAGIEENYKEKPEAGE